MKYLLSILMVLAVLGTTNAQNETIERAGYHSVISRDYQIGKQLTSVDYALEMNKRFHQRLNTGVITTIIGAGLLVTAANWDVPVYGVGQNKKADRLSRERSAVKWVGIGVTAIGSFLVVDSFKFHKRATFDLSATSFRVRYSLGL